MDEELLKEISQVEKTALVVWDVQNFLVSAIFNKEEFLASLNRLIGAAHKKGIPVFFSKITPLPERFESAPRKLFWRKRKMNLTPQGLELTIPPSADDIVVPKNTASMFMGTNFELMLRNAGINTLVFTGIATEFGVESSGRDASNRGFFSIIARDAVSSSNQEAHERSLKNMENLLILLSTDEILKIWNP